MEMAAVFNHAAFTSDDRQFTDIALDYAHPDAVSDERSTIYTQEFNTIAAPDQVAWAADGTSFFYSVRIYIGELPLTHQQYRAVAPLAEGFAFPDYMVSIRHYDTITGEDTLIYTAPENTYAVNQLRTLPGSEELLFTHVPNVMRWVEALERGDLKPFENLEVHSSTVPLAHYRLNLNDGTLANMETEVFIPDFANIYTAHAC